MIEPLTKQRVSNRAVIAEFEQGQASEPFHHADHVRVAFAYVSELPLLEAIAKFSAALQRFALAKGKPHLYHQTITWAYLLLIHERMARDGCVDSGLPGSPHCSSPHPSPGQISPGQSWEEFSECNRDLLTWKGGILERYYSRATLDSDLARQVFVLPDRGIDAA